MFLYPQNRVRPSGDARLGCGIHCIFFVYGHHEGKVGILDIRRLIVCLLLLVLYLLLFCTGRTYRLEMKYEMCITPRQINARVAAHIASFQTLNCVLHVCVFFRSISSCPGAITRSARSFFSLSISSEIKISEVSRVWQNTQLAEMVPCGQTLISQLHPWTHSQSFALFNLGLDAVEINCSIVNKL